MENVVKPMASSATESSCSFQSVIETATATDTGTYDHDKFIFLASWGCRVASEQIGEQTYPTLSSPGRLSRADLVGATPQPVFDYWAAIAELAACLPTKRSELMSFCANKYILNCSGNNFFLSTLHEKGNG